MTLFIQIFKNRSAHNMWVRKIFFRHFYRVARKTVDGHHGKNKTLCGINIHISHDCQEF